MDDAEARVGVVLVTSSATVRPRQASRAGRSKHPGSCCSVATGIPAFARSSAIVSPMAEWHGNDARMLACDRIQPIRSKVSLATAIGARVPLVTDLLARRPLQPRDKFCMHPFYINSGDESQASACGIERGNSIAAKSARARCPSVSISPMYLKEKGKKVSVAFFSWRQCRMSPSGFVDFSYTAAKYAHRSSAEHVATSCAEIGERVSVCNKYSTRHPPAVACGKM